MPPMKKPILILIAVALVACGKKSDDAKKDPAAGGGGGETPSCTVAAAKAVASLGPGADATGMKEKLQAIYATRCTEDKWPADVIKCYASAAGMQGLTACRGQLPPDLGNKLRSEIMATMAGAAGSMGRPPMGHPGGGAAGGSGAPAAGGAGAPPAGGAGAPPAGGAGAPPASK
jgi:hypothetical protein